MNSDYTDRRFSLPRYCGGAAVHRRIRAQATMQLAARDTPFEVVGAKEDPKMLNRVCRVAKGKSIARPHKLF